MVLDDQLAALEESRVFDKNHRGGDPKKIKASQRLRYASEALVDEVLDLYEDHRKSAPPTWQSNHDTPGG